MKFDEAMARLDARTNYEASGRLVAPNLDRMRALMGLLGSPEKSLPAVHVTGTNGKTTCARAATSFLRASSLTIGTYTSPHLVSAAERIAIDGEPIASQELANVVTYLEPFFAEVDAQGTPLTWFEAMTAAAVTHFSDVAVDAGVFEVGMGGEWDATNVIDAQVAVVTEVALDHPQLGPTTVDIAREKAGIIKDGAIVITAERDASVVAVLEERCRARKATLRRLGVDFAIEERLLAVGGSRLAVSYGGRLYEDLFLPLYGAGLTSDAVLGIAAGLALLGDREPDDELMAEAFAGVQSPGRVEVVRRSPLVVLDGAHNPDAAAELVRTMRETFHWDALTLVCGMLGDKDVEGILRELSPLAAGAIVAPVGSPRSAPPQRLKDALASFGVNALIAPSIATALTDARAGAAANDCVLVAGSLYTVGEAKQSLREEMQ